jgi:hypothetical protein
MNVVPAVQTPMQRDAVCAAFVEAAAYAELEITPGGLCCIVSKTALETGRWGPHVGLDGKPRGSLWGYEFGNIKASKSWKDADRPVQMYRCNEVIAGVVKWFDPPHVQTHFRAHPDAVTGALEYLLFTSSRYPAAWARAMAGDPAGFVHELKRKGYFTADEGPYVKAVSSMFREFLPFVEGLSDAAELSAEPVPAELDELEQLRLTLPAQLDADLVELGHQAVEDAVRQGLREMSSDDR